MSGESEAVFTLGRRQWTFTGWRADLLFGLTLSPFAFVFVVGVVTVVGWFL